MASIYDPIPNSPFYSQRSNQISTPQGYLVAGTGITVDQFGTLLVASAFGGTVTGITTGIGLGAPGPSTTITTSGTIDLLPATASSLGGVKVGANLLVAPDGTLSAFPPGIGTITGVYGGAGLSGGGASGNVTLSLDIASTTQYGGVSVSPTGGISISSGVLSLAAATTSQRGGVQLATGAEAIAGVDPSKAVTPAALAAKTATLLRPGIVQLSDSVAIADSTKAATQTAAFTANTAALAAQATASAALPKAGGTMTGVITFAPAQTFPGVAFPVATANSLGVISAGPGLSVNASGVLSTVNNGTVTAVTAGPGLGNPGPGGTISSFGTLRLLPPTGTDLGGVKAGQNVSIAFDGTISVPGSNFIATNNQYSYNSYIWPVPDSFGFTPGANGQVLTIIDKTSGQIGWTSTGTLQSVVAGPGLTVTSTPSTATVSLATISSITPGNVGGTALIPTLAINPYGQVVSSGLANPFAGFQTPTVTAPFILVMDFAGNNTNWAWTTNGNTTIQNPLNAESGQTGTLLITQDPLSTYSIVWGNSWKFGNFSPFTGAGLAEVTMLKFTVVAPNYIVVDTVVPNIG